MKGGCKKVKKIYLVIVFGGNNVFYIFNRAVVAGAVLQSPPLLINSFMVFGNIFKTLKIPNQKS